MKLFYILSDCGTPSETGYTFTGTTATTYQGTSSASCATGYEGTASPTSVTCEDTGSWTTVLGCSIKGICAFVFLSKSYHMFLFSFFKFSFWRTFSYNIADIVNIIKWIVCLTYLCRALL